VEALLLSFDVRPTIWLEEQYMTNKVLAATALVIALGIPATVLAQDFIGYEGRNAVREGDGGAKKTVEGVDFWSEGAPPRRYQLIGYINDRRHKSGIFGAISMAGLEKDIAAVVKQNGGNAVILMQAGAEDLGAVGTGVANGGFGYGMAARVQKQNSKFAVVKYLPDAPVLGGVPPANAVAPAAASVAPAGTAALVPVAAPTPETPSAQPAVAAPQ
jgi:hypothetical protein